MTPSVPPTRDETAAAAWLLRRAREEVECPVAGYSMAPTLPAKAVVRARSALPAEIVEGQVILFKSQGRLIVHRIVWHGRMARGWLITRGDGRWVPDPPIRTTEVLGLVTSVGSGPSWKALPKPPKPSALGWAATLALAMLLEIHPAAAVRFAELARFLRNGRHALW